MRPRGPRCLFCRRLEMEAEFGRHRSRRDVVRSAEGGKEIVERRFVGHVDNCEASAPTEAIAVKQIVVANRKVKEVAWSNARWIVIVVFGARRRYLDVLGTVLRGWAKVRPRGGTDRRGRRRINAGAGQPRLELLVCSQAGRRPPG